MNPPDEDGDPYLNAVMSINETRCVLLVRGLRVVNY